MRRGRWVGWAFAGLVSAAAAVELDTMDVRVDDGLYQITIDARLDARPAAVFAVLTDYEHLERLHPDVKTATVRGELDADTVRVHSVIRACVAFFCRDLDQVQIVTEHDPYEIMITTVPALSNFDAGSARWSVEPCGARASCVHYEGEFDPAFFIPPLIGPWMVKRSLRAGFEEMFQRLERQANERP